MALSMDAPAFSPIWGVLLLLLSACEVPPIRSLRRLPAYPYYSYCTMPPNAGMKRWRRRMYGVGRYVGRVRSPFPKGKSWA